MIDTNNRIKQIRNQLNLSQKEFGERVGVSRDVIANIENERVDPSEPLIKLICREFSINYNWLMTGEGEMLHESSNPVADAIDDLLDGENETAKAVFRAFANFTDDDWKTVQKFIDSFQKNKSDP